jgi:hypothetical protein
VSAENDGGYLVPPGIRGEILAWTTREPKKRDGWSVKMRSGCLAGVWLWPADSAHRLRCSRTSGIAVFRTRKQAREAIKELGSGRPVRVTVTVREHTRKR